MIGFLPWLSWGISLGCMLIGAFAIAAPEPASRAFGLPHGASWAQAAGARDIFLGLAIMFTFLHGHFELLGELCAATAVVPAVDALVTLKAGAKKQSMMHALGFVGVLAYGLLLIFTN